MKKMLGCLISCVVIFTMMCNVEIFTNTSTAYEKYVTESISEEYEPDIDLMRFFFLPFESGSIDEATVNYGSYGKEEVYIGIFSWTTLADLQLSEVQNLCRGLSRLDCKFAGELERYSYWNNNQVIKDLSRENSRIARSFKKLDKKDHQRFLSLQLAFMENRYETIMKELGSDWLLNGEHSPALVGSYYSMLNWSPYNGWEKSISPEKSDKENIISLYRYLFENISDDVTKRRFEQQFLIAMDMLYGESDENDIHQFLKNPEIY